MGFILLSRNGMDQDTLSLLKKELYQKDSTLTEVRLDALTSAHQVDQMKEMLIRLKVCFKFFPGQKIYCS